MALSDLNVRQHLRNRMLGLGLTMLAGIGLVTALAGFAVVGLVLLLAAGAPGLYLLGGEWRSALTGRRGAAGVGVGLQVALAAILLLGVNVFSFRHYKRLDWTRDREFTLAPDVREKLRKLSGETTVVVYQNHKAFGKLSDRPDDRFDSAAERKVVEKVNDLVDQLREFGPQFKVVVLDVKDEDFDEELAKLTKDREDLRQAVDSAPENSIFFYVGTGGKIQRLGFNAFYQLDKTSSREDNGGQGNLVLRHHDRGIDAFVRRVLNIDMKRPKVAILVIHEALSTHEGDVIGLKGMGKSLASNGFEVVDVILKKFDPSAPESPVVYTFDESKFDTLEEELKAIKSSAEDLESTVKEFTALRAKVDAGDDDAVVSTITQIEITNEVRQAGGLVNVAALERLKKNITEEATKKIKTLSPAEKKRWVDEARDYLSQVVNAYTKELETVQKDQRQTTQARDALSVESATELRRMTDLKAKLTRLLADCDLVIMPRFTIHTVSPRAVLANRLHALDEAQIAAVKSFMADGKPVLACFGPTNDASPEAMGITPPDGMEDLLGQMGIRLGKQTILYRAEVKSLSAQSEFGVPRAVADVPPVKFDWETKTLPGFTGKTDKGLAPNRIRESMRLAARSVGKDLDLQIRYARPVFFVGDRTTLKAEPEFMMTDSRCWSEDRPFPMGRNYHPTPPKEDGPRGTLESKGNGPFTIGVAVEERVPASWYASKKPDPALVRVAVVGHGGWFCGTDLPPAREKLLLDTCHWLIGQDDLLAQQENPEERGIWKFPRLETLGPASKALLKAAAKFVLPGFVICLGIVVLMLRHMR